MDCKRFVKYFFILNFIFIVALPISNYFNKDSHDYKSVFFSLDIVEKYTNYAVYKFFNRSMVQEDVVVGKDGFLFLGNEHGKVLHKTNGIYRPSGTLLDSWVKKLSKIQQWYRERGILFMIVVAPNKASIYPEKLPDYIVRPQQTITDDIVQKALTSRINILDLRATLISNKSETYYLYNPQGSHWNVKGASIAYNAIMRKLSYLYSIEFDIPNVKLADHRTNRDSLLMFLKMKDLLESDSYDNEYEIVNLDESICYGDIDKHNGLLKFCRTVENPRVAINAKPKYTVNTKPLNNLKLLLLCDSFGTAPSQLYNSSFNTVFKWHYYHIKGDKLKNFIENNKPDIVIYQIVERALFNNSIVAPLH